jgi:hypothetical protein
MIPKDTAMNAHNPPKTPQHDKPLTKVQKHRAKMRAQGLKLKQIWVPDVHSEAWKAEARRQCLSANASRHEAEHQAWVDSIVDMESWPEWNPKEA